MCIRDRLSLICMYTPQNLVTIHITYSSRFILSHPASNTSSNMICCPWFQLIWFSNSTQQHWKSIRGHEVLLWSELWCESADHCIPHLSSSVQTFRPAVVIADHIASSKLWVMIASHEEGHLVQMQAVELINHCTYPVGKILLVCGSLILANSMWIHTWICIHDTVVL